MILQVYKAELALTIPFNPYLNVELSGLVNVKAAQTEARLHRHAVSLQYCVTVDYEGEVHAKVRTVYRDLFCHN